jgi:long-chain acyl-CoA synthetase
MTDTAKVPVQDTLAERAEIESTIDGLTIGELLRRNATERGATPALSWMDGATTQTLTWAEARERVAEAACGLAAIGLAPGDKVAIMAGNRAEHVLADQAVVHAGGVPLTLYDTFAPEQIRYIAGDAGATVAIIEDAGRLARWEQALAELPGIDKVVVIDPTAKPAGDRFTTWDELLTLGRARLAEDREGFERRWREVAPSDPATLIYTSGTTGPPKGVALTHRNILFEVEVIARTPGLPDNLVSVSYLPLAHIAERVLSVYLPLRKSAHVYFCPEVSQVIAYLQRVRPTLFFGVPRVWEKARAGVQAKLDAEPNARRKALVMGSIAVARRVRGLTNQGKRPGPWLAVRHRLADRIVLAKVRHGLGLDRCEWAASSAAPLPIDVIHFFDALGITIHEVYGMTELTGMATANSRGATKLGTVGRACRGVELKLADDGEVLIRGPLVTPGYHNRPEATAELIDADGWVHTGDIGQLDADGFLSIVDRKKELIITAGGKNISPANIEGMLKEHPLVGQALAIGDRRAFVSALIVLDAEMAPAWAASHGIGTASLAELAEHPLVHREIAKAVETVNARLSRVERVKAFRILPVEWTPDSGELTPKMSLRRKVIHSKYVDVIDQLYAG